MQVLLQLNGDEFLFQRIKLVIIWKLSSNNQQKVTRKYRKYLKY